MALQAAIKEAKAEKLLMQQRFRKLLNMAQRKDKAITSLLEKWNKKEMPRINRVVGAKRRKR